MTQDKAAFFRNRFATEQDQLKITSKATEIEKLRSRAKGVKTLDNSLSYRRIFIAGLEALEKKLKIPHT